MPTRSYPRLATSAAVAALLMLLPCGLSLADNLTNLLDTDDSLISQGDPSDVEFNDEFDYGPNGRELNDNIEPTLGWTMNATITPDPEDVEVGQTRLIMEIGGNVNGTGLWLIDGIPTLALKTGGGGAFPSTLVANDLDITNNAAAIYSSFGKLTAGNEATVAATWNANNEFTLAVQDNDAQLGVLQSATVTGTSNDYNWYGNSTFLEGNLAGDPGSYGGLSGASDNPFSADNAASFDGTFSASDTMLWNEPATLSLNDPAKPVLTLTIDRETGNVTLTNPSNAPVDINAYTLIGGRSGFHNDSASWNQFSDSEPGEGWMTTDPAGVQKDIGESTATGSFTLAANGQAGDSYDFGNIWAQSPFSDVSARFDVVGGDPVNALVEYTGDEIIFGDYDFSGSIDEGDWPTILSGLISDVSEEDSIAQYLAGDLTGDGAVDREDFRLYKNLLADAVQAPQIRVPEPTTLALFGLASLGIVLAAGRRGRSCLWLLVAMLAGIAANPAAAADIYFVNDAGEIRSFTSISGVGANPLDPQSFTGGTLVNSVTGYGEYQGFTAIPNGTVYGVNNAGGVDSWPSLNDWINNTGISTESPAGTYASNGEDGSVHGISFDGNTGAFYVIYEGVEPPGTAGPDSDGDLGQYSTLSNFVNNLNPIRSQGAYGGNIMNFYYPDEDAPASEIPTNEDAAPGSNYFQITGGGQLEGWLDLFTPGFGYVAGGATPGGGGQGGNRSYQNPGFGNNVIGGFALVPDIDDLKLRVDTRTGMVSLVPGDTTSRTIDFLQIESVGGGLLPGGYTGLGGDPDFPQGDGTANSMGWDQAPSNATSTTVKAEAFAFGSSQIEAEDDEIPLGMFYDTAQDLQDLSLSFDNAGDGSTVTVGGIYIEYFESAGSSADLDGDGDVDGFDFLAIQRSDPSLIPTWKSEYGTGSLQGGTSPVPEPGGLIVVLGLMASACFVRPMRD